MLPAVSVRTASGSIAEIRFTERADGDLHVDSEPVELAARRRGVVDRPWNWLCQVHGAEVVEATGPGSCTGAAADGLVTGCLWAPIAVQAADCAPVVLVGHERIAVVHAGWRGLVAGVLQHAVDALACDPHAVQAHLGPVIRPEQYEFGESDLATIVASHGSVVRASTAKGSPALDVPALVAEVLRRAGVDDLVDHGYDTADCRFFSHRLRSESRHHSAVAWLRLR
jgi:YfiH family protein